MKKYSTPEIEINILKMEDIMDISGGDTNYDEELPR